MATSSLSRRVCGSACLGKRDSGRFGENEERKFLKCEVSAYKFLSCIVLSSVSRVGVHM